MPKRSKEQLQRKRWFKALGIARILFEEDGYHTAYLDEIEAFLCAEPPPIPAPPPALDADTAARVARLAERLGTVAGWCDDSQDPRRGTGADLGQVYEEVRQLVATDPQAAHVLFATYAPAHGRRPEVTRSHADATSRRDASQRAGDASAPVEPPAPAASPYHYDHYPNSRFWAAYAGKELLAVTVYRKGAREVTARLEAKDRTIAELKRQIAALSTPHP